MRVRTGVKDARREGDERGFVVVWMVIVLVLLIAIAAFAVDLVHAYQEAQHLQNAVDAAALAGAAEIPADLHGVTAQTQAAALLKSNNFAIDGTDPSNTAIYYGVDPSIPNQVDVDVKHTFDTFFGRVIGFPTLTVHKHAAAQYDAPIAMGSPANNLGDVPPNTCTQMGFAPGGFPCLNQPSNAHQSLWVQIQGLSTKKDSGNAVTTTYCRDAAIKPTDGCTGNTNNEFNATHPGEYISIRNDQDNRPLYIYVYDAAFVDTRHNSSGPPAVVNSPCGKTFDNAPDPVAYADTSQCPGDQDQLGAPGSTPYSFDTNYEVLAPDGTPNTPYDNPHYNVPGCTPHDVPGDDPLNGPDPIHRDENAHLSATDLQYFHQWVEMCKIPDAGPAGSEWILHVSSLNAIGRGSNQFSVVALHTPPPPIGPGGELPLPGLQVFTRQKLPLFATNLPDPFGNTGPGTFYVARVKPSSADRLLHLSFFDLGDSPGGPGGASTGTISLQLAGAAIPGGLTNCSWAPPPGFSTNSAGPSPDGVWGAFNPPGGCSIHYDKATWDAQWVEVDVPIPASYTCNDAFYDNCWIQMTVAPDAGMTLADATTWDATMKGAPVRLVG